LGKENPGQDDLMAYTSNLLGPFNWTKEIAAAFMVWALLHHRPYLIHGQPN